MRVRYDAQKVFDEAEKLARLAGLAGPNACFPDFSTGENAIPTSQKLQKHGLTPANPANPAKILDEPAVGECSGCSVATFATTRDAVLAWLRRGRELYPRMFWGPASVPLERIRLFERDADTFLRAWGSKALELGWTGEELFGLDPVAPMARYDGMGLIWLLKGREQVTELTATHAKLSGNHTFSRRAALTSEIPIPKTATPVIPASGMRTIHHGRRTRR
jgi:hypothetical protein